MSAMDSYDMAVEQMVAAALFHEPTRIEIADPQFGTVDILNVKARSVGDAVLNLRRRAVPVTAAELEAELVRTGYQQPHLWLNEITKIRAQKIPNDVFTSWTRQIAEWAHDRRSQWNAASAQDSTASTATEWRYGPPLTDWLGDAEPDEDDSGDWDIRGLIPKHVPSFLAGDPKVGKTMIMESWGVALALGMPDWCGFPIYGRKRVLLMPREDGERTSKIRLWQLARGAGLERPHELAEWLSVDPTSPLNLENKDHIARLRLACERFDVVMIDSFTTAHLGDENSAKDVARAMEPVRDVALGTKTSLVLVHHYNGKGNTDDRRGVKHRLRGSSALAGYARHIVGVSHGPRRGQLELASDGNLEYQIEPSVVELVNEVNSTGRKTLRYRFLGSALNAAIESVCDEVVAAVRASANGLTANGIYREVGGNRKVVLAAIRKELEPIRRLERRGQRIHCKEVVPGTSGNHEAATTGTGSAPYKGAPEPGAAWWDR